MIFNSTSDSLKILRLESFYIIKYVVKELIESILYEIDAFNIRVTLIEFKHVRDNELLSFFKKAFLFFIFNYFFIKFVFVSYIIIERFLKRVLTGSIRD